MRLLRLVIAAAFLAPSVASAFTPSVEVGRTAVCLPMGTQALSASLLMAHRTWQPRVRHVVIEGILPVTLVGLTLDRLWHIGVVPAIFGFGMVVCGMVLNDFSVIHRILTKIKRDADDTPAHAKEFMNNIYRAMELLRDLRDARARRSIEMLMDKWELILPSEFATFLIADLPDAIAYTEELLIHMQERRLHADTNQSNVPAMDPKDIRGGFHIPTITRVSTAKKRNTQRIKVRFDSLLGDVLGVPSHTVSVGGDELATPAVVLRKLKARYPLHISRNIWLLIDGKSHPHKGYAIQPNDFVSTVYTQKPPTHLAGKFLQLPEQGYIAILKKRSPGMAEVLLNYTPWLAEMIASVALGERDPRLEWDRLQRAIDEPYSEGTMRELRAAQRAIGALALFQVGVPPTAVAMAIEPFDFAWENVEATVREWNGFYKDHPEKYGLSEWRVSPLERIQDAVTFEDYVLQPTYSILHHILTELHPEWGPLTYKRGYWRMANGRAVPLEDSVISALKQAYERAFDDQFFGFERRAA